jgi:hypothetical protein
MNTRFLVVALAAVLLCTAFTFPAVTDLRSDMLAISKVYAGMVNRKMTVTMSMTTSENLVQRFGGTVEIGENYRYMDFMNSISVISGKESFMVNKVNKVIMFNRQGEKMAPADDDVIEQAKQFIDGLSTDKLLLVGDEKGIRRVRIRQDPGSAYAEVLLAYSTGDFLLKSIAYTYADPEDSGVKSIEVTYASEAIKSPDASPKWKLSIYVTKKDGEWKASDAYKGYNVVDLTPKP